MTSFKPSNEHWTRSDKQRFLVFMRILIKYLEITHLDNVRRDVMEGIEECKHNYLQQRKQQKYPSLCLTSMLHNRLRETVPETTWREAERYMDQYLYTRSMRRAAGIAAAARESRTQHGSNKVVEHSL